MQTFVPDELEEDILSDLMEEINELYESSEQTLIELELRPEDNELQRALFRSIHTIKGDLGLVNFTPMIPLLQHVEDLLDYLRKGQVSYTSTMSDLVLLTMDRVKAFVEAVMAEGKAEYDNTLHEQLVLAISRISPDNTVEHEKLLTEAVLLLNPALDVVTDGGDPDTVQIKPPTLATTGIPKDMSSEKKLDVLFFRDLMQTIERRSNYWAGRGDRIAKLAMYINDIAGNPIEEDQLAVASYVHDFGMAFMPLKILHKGDALSEIEFNLMRSHVYKSARLLEHLDQWDMARKIVMQHHERTDGTGYPLGLKEEGICEGAKLLAIIDTYDAMTHSRAHNEDNLLSKKEAVIAINRSAKGQFSMKWVRHFNQGMTSLLTKGA
ncbi:metal-dependent phosphohydrolase [Alteromonas australica]|jgi:HD-GYP domain-containing protein (c-di-GMP phosphodiesterase class II)|uniref:HD domain-containing protein n=3 Tax=Alteromonas australica TaxID=589873 RepID=A0A075NZ50_9ALTE|nr:MULTISPECIES: HD domain-containing phosphohydrolase [Alteromonas]MAF69449.1 metal-dependent phosphohydrolase [Alteromonas sp.]AIF99934.1 metal-dependent phosphohydrolase [Alteromonas australica]AJP44902.1 metal-dependent phosphohydrolase [Alteromonas australica]MAF71718.1 metal-dependent phosphohydrolase [Alteromonas sp.]MAO29461.1 metal-dependent phosphohydrolase [Alteromonas sp.]|tara:strand:- start:8523 stop:9662 length:1140 start_codon:yes stop_codon:yes gene_type:complete